MEIQKEDLILRRETLIKHIIGEMKKEAEDAWCQNLTARFRVGLSWEEFLILFSESANYILRKRGCSRTFEVDEVNRPIIEQLWLYVGYNPAFKGDLNKGLMMQGSIGVGKSLLMESFAFLQNRLAHRTKAENGESYKGTQFIHSTELAERFKSAERGVRSFSKCTLVIDEFGREPKSVMDYGNVMNPMAELISVRADSAVITHGTTNYKLERLASDEFYGEMIGDRMRSMFNFITLGGKSRRR